MYPRYVEVFRILSKSLLIVFGVLFFASLASGWRGLPETLRAEILKPRDSMASIHAFRARAPPNRLGMSQCGAGEYPPVPISTRVMLGTSRRNQSSVWVSDQSGKASVKRPMSISQRQD